MLFFVAFFFIRRKDQFIVLNSLVFLLSINYLGYCEIRDLLVLKAHWQCDEMVFNPNKNFTYNFTLCELIRKQGKMSHGILTMITEMMCAPIGCLHRHRISTQMTTMNILYESLCCFISPNVTQSDVRLWKRRNLYYLKSPTLYIVYSLPHLNHVTEMNNTNWMPGIFVQIHNLFFIRNHTQRLNIPLETLFLWTQKMSLHSLLNICFPSFFFCRTTFDFLQQWYPNTIFPVLKYACCFLNNMYVCILLVDDNFQEGNLLQTRQREVVCTETTYFSESFSWNEKKKDLKWTKISQMLEFFILVFVEMKRRENQTLDHVDNILSTMYLDHVWKFSFDRNGLYILFENYFSRRKFVYEIFETKCLFAGG